MPTFQQPVKIGQAQLNEERSLVIPSQRETVIHNLLHQHGVVTVNVIFGINDDSALGALDDYRAAGLSGMSKFIDC